MENNTQTSPKPVKIQQTFTEWLFQTVMKTKEETDPVFKLANKFQYDMSWNTDLKELDELVRHVLLESVSKGFRPSFIVGACMKRFMNVDQEAIDKCYKELSEKTTLETMAIAYTCKLAWEDYQNYLKDYLQ